MINKRTFKTERIYEEMVFYPIEIPIFYKMIKQYKSTSQEFEDTDLYNYLTCLEPVIHKLFQKIKDGNVSSAHLVFHIYEIPYLCALIDAYLTEESIDEKDEKYLYDMMERIEALYYKHYSKIKKFNLCPTDRKKHIIQNIIKEKDEYFKVP